jgi:hypothetical protein
MDARHAAEQAFHRFADVGVQVDGIDDFEVAALAQSRQGAADALEPGAEVLAPVPGDQNQPAAGIEEREQGLHGAPRLGVVVEPPGGVEEGVDHRVSGDDDALIGGALAPQVGARRLRRREVEVGDGIGQLAVHLLGPGREHVAGAQARLHVADRNLAEMRRQGGGERGGGIAVHQHAAGLAVVEHPFHAGQHGSGNVGEILIVAHDVEVVIGTDVEEFQHLVQHVPMLRRHAHT